MKIREILNGSDKYGKSKFFEGYNFSGLNYENKVKTKFCAVVKADAYGHGASMCALALYDLVDCYAVAITEEGIQLRLSGINKEILVLTAPFPEDLERAVFYDLTLTVCSVEQFNAISKEAQRQGKKARVHIKFDTGMCRQGVKSLKILKEVMEVSVNDKYVAVTGIYSHFAKPEDEVSRKNAHDKFLLAIKLVKGYNNKITAHISASGGFIAGEYFDMVRIGILLYGYKPFPTKIIDVKPVMSIYAPVLCVQKWEKGSPALYGDIPVSKTGEYALVRYGYADGLPRKNIYCQHNNRCMDITAVDNSLIENGWCKVLGNADSLAGNYDTISYEILTKAAIRAEKIYLR